MAAYREKYTFKVEWLDQVASLKRYYLLQYYVTGGTNELELVRCAVLLWGGRCGRCGGLAPCASHAQSPRLGLHAG